MSTWANRLRTAAEPLCRNSSHAASVALFRSRHGEAVDTLIPQLLRRALARIPTEVSTGTHAWAICNWGCDVVRFHATRFTPDGTRELEDIAGRSFEGQLHLRLEIPGIYTLRLRHVSYNVAQPGWADPVRGDNCTAASTADADATWVDFKRLQPPTGVEINRTLAVSSLAASSQRGKLRACLKTAELFDGRWLDAHEAGYAAAAEDWNATIAEDPLNRPVRCFRSRIGGGCLIWAPWDCTMRVFNVSETRACLERDRTLIVGDSTFANIVKWIGGQAFGGYRNLWHREATMWGHDKVGRNPNATLGRSTKWQMHESHDPFVEVHEWPSQVTLSSPRSCSWKNNYVWSRSIVPTVVHVAETAKREHPATVVVNSGWHDLRDKCSNVDHCKSVSATMCLTPGFACRPNGTALAAGCRLCHSNSAVYNASLQWLHAKFSTGSAPAARKAKRAMPFLLWKTINMPKNDFDRSFPMSRYERAAALNELARSIFPPEQVFDVAKMTDSALPLLPRDNVHPDAGVNGWMAQALMHVLCSR